MTPGMPLVRLRIGQDALRGISVALPVFPVSRAGFSVSRPRVPAWLMRFRVVPLTCAPGLCRVTWSLFVNFGLILKKIGGVSVAMSGEIRIFGATIGE